MLCYVNSVLTHEEERDEGGGWMDGWADEYLKQADVCAIKYT